MMSRCNSKIICKVFVLYIFSFGFNGINGKLSAQFVDFLHGVHSFSDVPPLLYYCIAHSDDNICNK